MTFVCYPTRFDCIVCKSVPLPATQPPIETRLTWLQPGDHPPPRPYPPSVACWLADGTVTHPFHGACTCFNSLG